MEQKSYIAVDLGASNGRTIAGSFDGEKLSLKEVNRFENNYIRTQNGYYWDVLHLYSCILDGLRKFGVNPSGIGIDTWGVDFGLIDEQGKLIGNPRAYRDPRCLRGMAAFHEKYGVKKAFNITGIANYEFNTLYQLYDMAVTNDPQLDMANRLLLMPDLLSYMLCGRVSCEFTHASTTQLVDKDGGWSSELTGILGIKDSLLPQIQMSGEVKGTLVEAVLQETGLAGDVPVFCVGSHDTASAVASVPAVTDNYAFLSSGTWSLIGVEREDAFIDDVVFTGGFSNEGTITGGVRLLKNIMGLWIIQNCKRRWDAEEKVSWDDIVGMAKDAGEFESMIDVNAHEFFDGDNMPGKIQKFCADTGQAVPQTKGQIARTVYESLAMCYKEAFGVLEQIKGKRIGALHIIGGGSKNRLLNQFTANAIGRPVIAGPVEATAIGNLMVQVKASGEVDSLSQMSQVIRNSFDVETFEPQDTQMWEEQYEKYLKIKRQ